MAVHICLAALAVLSIMAQPVEPRQALFLCIAAIAAAAPGIFAALLAKRNHAVWANWLSFGDMLPLALPLACIAAWPELAVFAICHHIVRLFAGGWLLRRDGVRCEKNFTLILAYRQTLAHCHRFPSEVHPSENPLFQPARNAQNALAELLPLAGLLLGWLLTAMGLRLNSGAIAQTIAVILSILLAISLIRAHGRKLLPNRLPTLKCLLIVALRAVLWAFGLGIFQGTPLSRQFTIYECHALLVCALMPALSLPDELRLGGAEPQLCDTIDDATRWSFILWLIAGIVYII